MEFPLLVLICRCCEQPFALPAAPVTRVLGAAQFVSIAGLGGCAVGIVNVAGVNLALCDSRLALGLAGAELMPTDRFIELEPAVQGARRWLLWVEEVSQVITVADNQCDALYVSDDALVRHALRLPLGTVPLGTVPLGTVPLLNLAALEPSAVIGE